MNTISQNEKAKPHLKKLAYLLERVDHIKGVTLSNFKTPKRTPL
jgi:hypothetical protein